MSEDGLFNAVALFGAMANGPSNSGNRKDGKVCTAQGGECRFNSKYYTPGMRDAKSWQMPAADEFCPDRCAYLNDEARDMGSSEERHGRVADLIDGLVEQKAQQDAQARLLLASLGLLRGE
jgi:hypothetical protein